MKRSKWIAFIYLVLLNGALTVSATELTNKTWVVLASKNCPMGSREYHFSLLQEGVPKPGQPGFSWEERNLVFELVRQEEGATESVTAPVVLWVGYEFFWPRSAPWPTWSGAIVMNTTGKVAYLAVVRSLSVNVSVKLYAIDPEKPAASLPQCDEHGKLKDIKALLEGAQAPISEFRKTFHASCEVAGAQMKIDGQKLRLSLVRAECEPTRLSYDLTSKSWSEEPTAGTEKGK